MGISAVVAGTGFEGREKIIRQFCREGMQAILQREPHNPHDKNAIAVYLVAEKKLKQIGYIAAYTAKSLAIKLDQGEKFKAIVKSYYAPEGSAFPRVTLVLESGVANAGAGVRQGEEDEQQYSIQRDAIFSILLLLLGVFLSVRDYLSAGSLGVSLPPIVILAAGGAWYLINVLRAMLWHNEKTWQR